MVERAPLSPLTPREQEIVGVLMRYAYCRHACIDCTCTGEARQLLTLLGVPWENGMAQRYIDDNRTRRRLGNDPIARIVDGIGGRQP